MREGSSVFIVYDFKIKNITPVIRSVAERTDLIDWPGGPDDPRQGAIWDDIVQPGIDKSKRLLAYVDLPNANVSFEVGYALGRGKRVALAHAQEGLPNWLEQPPLDGLLCERIESVKELEGRIAADDKDWISIARTPEPGVDVLFLCPSSGPGSSYMRAKPEAWNEVPRHGWGLRDIPSLFEGVGHVVWVISGHNKGTDMRDGPENAALAVLAGYAKALSGVELNVFSASSARRVADVVTERHEFRDDGADLKTMLDGIQTDIGRRYGRDRFNQTSDRLSPVRVEPSGSELKRIYNTLQEECRKVLPSYTLMAASISSERLQEIVGEGDASETSSERQNKLRRILDALKEELLIDYQAYSRLGDEYYRIRILRADEDLIWEDWAPFYRDVMLTIWLPGVVNPLFEMIEKLDANEIKTCVDFGCGHGLLVERLQAMFPDAYVVGLDYSQSMLEIARKDHPECHFTWGTMFNLSAWSNQVDLATSTNSILPITSEAAFQMFQQVSSTVRQGGIFAGVLPSGDTIEHLIERATEAKVAAGMSESNARKEVEAYYVDLHGFDWQEGLYSDDPAGQHPQRVYWPEEIRELLHNCGFQRANLEKVYYPWSACKAFGWGYFPWAERVWDWAFCARKA